jgi:Fic family protein
MATRIEPCGIEEMIPEALTDLVVAIREEAGEIARGLHPDSVRELRGLVRIMSAHYSSLIEGHDTRPRDIEAALWGAPVENRPLAEEAAAHVRVQEWIDGLADEGALPGPTSVDFIVDVHRRFYAAMHEELRFAEQDGRRVEIVPGGFRTDEVLVGRHVPPAPPRIADFMAYYVRRYERLTRGATGRILAIPAAHHRLSHIHPFLDGNGRVGRLVSHAMIRRAGIGAGGLWSISRALARGLEDRGEYMRWMDAADMPRQGDRDGRGNLSMRSLAGFTGWFLTVMLDQIRFTRAMLDLDRLRLRYLSLVRDVTGGDERVGRLVDHVLRHGELARGDAEFVLRTGERTARTALKRASDLGFVTSSSPKTPVRIAFPIDYRERLFPDLFTEAPVDVPTPPKPPDRDG